MTRIRNTRIIATDHEVVGTFSFEQQIITGIDDGDTAHAELDWQDDLLLPGMVELHTDNLEKHLMPRPKVAWPVMPAILAHDAQIAAAGITTVLDAISIGDIDPDGVRMQTLDSCIAGLHQAHAAGVLRADHFLHLRLELPEKNLLTLFTPFLQDPLLKLVSLMDHTPGQRQWSDLTHYRTYMMGKRGWSAQKVETMLDEMMTRQYQNVAPNRAAVLAYCRDPSRPIPIAAHDDTTEQHVVDGVADGISISEFPTSIAAAQAARRLGQQIIMGGPNMVRGGSHSGNVSAAELARRGLLDALSSDYVPASLLHAAFLLQHDGFALPKAIATVSRNPARMAGLTDRGDIAIGQRADFLRVRIVDDVPIVIETWKAGSRIA